MPEAGARTDEELIAAARSGEARALDELIVRHQSRMLRVVRLLGVLPGDIEDVAQDVFLRVFRSLDSFQPRRATFGAWSYRIAVNAALDHGARRAREGPTDPLGDDPDAAGEAPPTESPDVRALRRRLLVALDELSQRERAVFVLREIEGLDSSEIGSVLGIHGITVRRHLARARARLRAALGEEESGIPIERIVEPSGSHE